jgi:uncharacterized protein (TIGR02391 family)
MPYLVNGQLVPEELIREECMRIAKDPQWQRILDPTEREQRLRFAAERCAQERMLIEQVAAKAVEVAVRKAGGYEEGELGRKLMRKAFESESGPLADMTLESGERKAQADLFAGAIGAAKNPASHRDVEMSKIEAARLILLASYLMSIVGPEELEPGPHCEITLQRVSRERWPRASVFWN